MTFSLCWGCPARRRRRGSQRSACVSALKQTKRRQLGPETTLAGNQSLVIKPGHSPLCRSKLKFLCPYPHKSWQHAPRSALTAANGLRTHCPLKGHYLLSSTRYNIYANIYISQIKQVPPHPLRTQKHHAIRGQHLQRVLPTQHFPGMKGRLSFIGWCLGDRE